MHIPIGLKGSKKSQLQWTGLESRKEKRKKEKRKINKTQRARKRKEKKNGKGRIWERNNYIKISL